MLGAPWLAAAPPVDADTTLVVAGACLVTLSVSGGSIAVPPIPPTTSTQVNVTGGGLCVVNGEMYVGITIGGTLASVGGTSTWTCLGGVAEGQLTINVTYSKAPGQVTAVVGFTAAAGAAVMTAVAPEPSLTFVGEGNFVEDVASHASCPTDGSAPTDWCGTFEFALVRNPLGR